MPSIELNSPAISASYTLARIDCKTITGFTLVPIPIDHYRSVQTIAVSVCNHWRIQRFSTNLGGKRIMPTADSDTSRIMPTAQGKEYANHSIKNRANSLYAKSMPSVSRVLGGNAMRQYTHDIWCNDHANVLSVLACKTCAMFTMQWSCQYTRDTWRTVSIHSVELGSCKSCAKGRAAMAPNRYAGHLSQIVKVYSSNPLI